MFQCEKAAVVLSVFYRNMRIGSSQLFGRTCVDDMSEESDDPCNPMIVHKLKWLKWCSQGKCIYTVYLSIYPHRTNGFRYTEKVSW